MTNKNKKKENKRVRGLLGYLINRGDFKPGVMRDGDGQPLLDISFFSKDKKIIYEDLDRILEWVDSGRLDLVDQYLNANGLTYSVFTEEGTDAPGVLVPCVDLPYKLPMAIVALARVTDTGVGDCVLNRVARCQWCGDYFLKNKKTKYKFCTYRCRSRHVNKKRQDEGYFQERRKNKNNKKKPDQPN